MMNVTTPNFLPLTGLFEPSAIQQLPDGRFLVLEDEKQHSFSLVTLNASGVVKQVSIGPGWFQGGDAIWNLDDLEGLAADSQGYLYAVTSHSRDDDGKEKKSREKLARFRIEQDRVLEPVVVGGLRRALIAAHPVLAAAALVEDAKSGSGLNIEGLEITPDRLRLLLGFRSPLQQGNALIASIDNPSACFDSGEEPRIAANLQALNLGGQGIRGLSFIDSLKGYLVISGPASREDAAFGLWLWGGQPGDAARRVTVPGLRGFERAEGISPALIDGVPKIVIVSDDGDRKKGRFARFIVLDPSQLHVAP